MDAQQIQITKDSQATTLGEYRHGLAELLPGWTGLRIVRFTMPEQITDRHVMARHPIVSLVCEGAMSSHMRMRGREMRSEVKAHELMFYSGGKEIDVAHWQTRQASLIAVELDPERLRLDAPGGARAPERHLKGEPRFTDPELGALVRMLWREGHAGCPQGRLFADSLCLGLAMHVYRRFGAARSERGEAGARLTHRQLQRIDDYIEAHLDQSIGLDDLAQAVGLSRYHFSRVFSNTLGRSPYQHVIRKRLERAHHLLLSSELPVAAVALSAGFSSQAHFSALCRRELGATPRGLREGR
jgi:AraC family transcriptional regulator